MTDIMIDIETLGARPGCIVLSIGAVAFDRATGKITSELDLMIDPQDSERCGLRCEAGTALWWMRQPRAAREALTKADEFRIYSLRNAVSRLERWFTFDVKAQPTTPVWAQGQDFDFPILGAAVRAVGTACLPWPHWMQRDTRTAYDICGFDPKTVTREGVYHDALDDCRHQVRCLHLALQQKPGVTP